MGEVGGNGSVVWQNKHLKGGGKKFKCKDKNGKLKHDELGLDVATLEVWGRDETDLNDIGKTAPDDLEPELKEIPKPFQKAFQEPGCFLVRLRFDDTDKETPGLAIEQWFAAAPASLQTIVRVFRQGSMVILAINVKAIPRSTWPEPGRPWDKLPFEIRYDW
jgi:hypothetical protein